MLYLIEITNLDNGENPKAIWNEAEMDSALLHFHQILASAMSNQNAVSCLCEIIDVNGAIIKSEYWMRT